MSREYLYFIFYRCIGLALKTLLLIYVIEYSTKLKSGFLETTFLILMGLLVIYKIPFYFDFYKSYFEQRRSYFLFRNLFDTYVVNMVMHSIELSRYLFFIIWYLIRGLKVTIALTLALIIENIYG